MRHFLILAACAACVSLRPAPALAEPLLTLGSATAAPGGSVTLPISLNAEAKDVSGVEIHLDHSSVTPAGGPALTFPALERAAIAASLGDVSFDSNAEAGLFHVALVRAEPFAGPLDLITLTVQVPATAAPGAVYALRLTAKLNDPDGHPIFVTARGGTLTIEGDAPTVRRGDVTGDGVVNVSDATLALRFAVSLASPTSAQLAAADLNADGAITVADVTRILRAAVGLETL